MDSRPIAAAFVSAWAACENPPLDCTNPHFKNRYASLGATLDAVRRACAPQGLAYVQSLCRCEDGTREFRSRVMDAAGGSLDLSSFPVETPSNPQAFGSNLTYAKRQQAQADWGITGDEDDDAEQAAAAQARPARKPATDRFAGVRRLKAEAIAAGVDTDSIALWIEAEFGKPMAEFTDPEIKTAEDYIEALVADARAARMGQEA